MLDYDMDTAWIKIGERSIAPFQPHRAYSGAAWTSLAVPEGKVAATTNKDVETKKDAP